MRIFIDIGHPAHVHYFKNFIRIMQRKGHKFLITARDKEFVRYLLQKEGITYHNRGKGKNNIVMKLLYMLFADLILLRKAIRFKPDLFLSFASPYAAQVSAITRTPHIAFDDTEIAIFSQKLYYPFTEVILNPKCYRFIKSPKQIFFDSYMELCYLHPSLFTPDKSVLDLLRLKKEDKFVIVRFIAWNANHDLGLSGLSNENKMKLIRELHKFAKVFISSETPLPVELQPYKLNLPPEKIHDLLAFSSLLVGESSTMASEAAMLGVPALFIDEVGRGYTDEQEMKYGLTFYFKADPAEQIRFIEKAVELIKMDGSQQLFQDRRKNLLNEKINTTAFMVWFIENYPESAKIMKTNPDYQLRFK